jgi:hypothetical protein
MQLEIIGALQNKPQSSKESLMLQQALETGGAGICTIINNSISILHFPGDHLLICHVSFGI